MLGESLDEIGNLMLDPDITKLVSNFTSSIFDEQQNYDKIQYIKDAIRTEKSDKIKEKYNKLLERVIAAEEVRILGKILKINQGLPTNTMDAYTYIKSIEKYIECRYNKETIDQVNNARDILIDAINNSPGDFKLIKRLSDAYKEIKYQMETNWISFDLIKFIEDPIYQQEQIDKYEGYKINFNILEVIESVPHFREMFKVLLVNKQVLNNLSVRNKVEDIVWNSTIHRSKTSGNTNITKPLNKKELSDIKDQINQYLIDSWIISKNIEIKTPAQYNNNPNSSIIRLDSVNGIAEFREYVEKFAIPLLKEKLSDNRFIQLLTFGLKRNVPFYKMPFNMTQIDNTQKTKTLYEEVLTAFNDLNTVNISDIDMRLTDLFYLYNLIVNQDRFGPNSLTRIFEDLIVSEGNENLLVYDFNNWIDQQDPNELAERFINSRYLSNTLLINEIESTESIVGIGAPVEDSSIGFNESNEREVEQEVNKKEPETRKIQDQSKIAELAEIWSKKEAIDQVSNEVVITSTPYYHTDPSTTSKLIEIIKSAELSHLHIISDEDFFHNDNLKNESNAVKNAKGFVKDGEIYINVSRATDDTVIHEFSHLYLANAKVNNSDRYYSLLSKVRDTDIWKRMRLYEEYSNKKGSDFDEEVLATIISNYYKNNTTSNNENTKETDIAIEALQLVSKEFNDLILSDIIPRLDDAFISNYKLSQKIATIKNQFIKTKIIEEYCK